MVAVLGLVALYQLRLIYNELSKIDESIIETHTHIQRLKDKLTNIDVCVWNMSGELGKLIAAKVDKPKQANARPREKRRN